MTTMTPLSKCDSLGAWVLRYWCVESTKEVRCAQTDHVRGVAKRNLFAQGRYAYARRLWMVSDEGRSSPQLKGQCEQRESSRHRLRRRRLGCVVGCSRGMWSWSCGLQVRVTS
jgi:hypothetical protein